jgi:hypothetical protein
MVAWNLAWCGSDHLAKCREAQGQLEKRSCGKHGGVGGRELKSEANGEQSLLTPDLTATANGWQQKLLAKENRTLGDFLDVFVYRSINYVMVIGGC